LVRKKKLNKYFLNQINIYVNDDNMKNEKEIENLKKELLVAEKMFENKMKAYYNAEKEYNNSLKLINVKWEELQLAENMVLK